VQKQLVVAQVVVVHTATAQQEQQIKALMVAMET
jgi:hypothetical protein